MSTSSTTMFKGTSRYSTDLSNVVARAVQIASLPLNLMQSSLTTMQDEQTELGNLNTKITSVQSAVSGLVSATGSSSYSASVSDTNVSASLSTGAQAATYTIKVDNLGSYNSTMSSDPGGTNDLKTVTDPSTGTLSTSTDYVLKVTGSTDFNFSGTSLNDMVTKINGSGLPVQASVVNVGSSSSPDYRLSIQSTKLGAFGISLSDGNSTQLLDTLSAGAPASYYVNGRATASTSDSDTVQLAPGVSVTLKAQTASGASASTITITRSTLSVQSALTSFVSSYNAAVDELDKNRGSAGGALSGQSLVYDIDSVLSGLQSYSAGSGTFQSLADLGITASDQNDGHLVFDTAKFATATTGHTNDLMSFLGDATTGGFLKAATDAMNGLEDSDTGELSMAISAKNTEIKNQQDDISNEQDRITQLQTDLNDRMAAADAAIAQLEQSATYMQSMFDAMSQSSKNQ